MCSFSGATRTSRVRHNADYVPYAKIRFDLRQRVASLTLNCNGDFAIRAYCCAGLMRIQDLTLGLLPVSPITGQQTAKRKLR